MCILYVIPFFREGKVKQLILFNQSHPQVIHHPRFFGAFHCETLTVIHFTFLSKLIFKTPKSLPVSKGQRFPLFRALVHESRLCNIHWVRHHLFRKVEKIHKNQQPAPTCTEKRKNNAYQESYSKKNLWNPISKKLPLKVFFFQISRHWCNESCAKARGEVQTHLTVFIEKLPSTKLT